MFSQKNRIGVEHANIRSACKLQALVPERVLRILETVFETGVLFCKKKLFCWPSHLYQSTRLHAPKCGKLPPVKFLVGEHAKNGAVSNERCYPCSKARVLAELKHSPLFAQI
jgi:hypothetical protein